MKKLQTIKHFKIQHTNTLVKEKIILLTLCVFKRDLNCQKIVVENRSIVGPPTNLSHSYILRLI